MSLRVMRSTANAQRSGNEPLLHVVPHRSTRDVGEVGEVLDRVAGVVWHLTAKYSQFTVTFQLSHYESSQSHRFVRIRERFEAELRVQDRVRHGCARASS